MLCPTCFAPSIVIMAVMGSLPPHHGQPNLVSLCRCEEGHSFETVSIFDGKEYRPYYAPATEFLATIKICWD